MINSQPVSEQTQAPRHWVAFLHFNVALGFLGSLTIHLKPFEGMPYLAWVMYAATALFFLGTAIRLRSPTILIIPAVASIVMALVGAWTMALLTVALGFAGAWLSGWISKALLSRHGRPRD